MVSNLFHISLKHNLLTIIFMKCIIITDDCYVGDGQSYDGKEKHKNATQVFVTLFIYSLNSVFEIMEADGNI